MNININSLKSIYLSILFNEIELATATGFLINQGSEIYLITNRHVVTGRDNQTNKCLDQVNAGIPNKIKIWFPYRENNYYKWSNISYDLYNANGEPLWMEHPIYKNKADVIALNLGTFDQNLFCYNIHSPYSPIVTENVFIIGYPFGYNVRPKEGRYAIWSTGTVASDPDLDIEINGEQLPAFLIDAKTRKGQSGSPVIYHSANGFDRQANGFAIYGGPITHELGIYSGRINADSDLGYVWKWKLIEEIISTK